MQYKGYNAVQERTNNNYRQFSNTFTVYLDEAYKYMYYTLLNYLK